MLRVALLLPLFYAALAFLGARRVVIRGWSMYPALAPGEYVIFDGLALRWRPPRRGDIVLAWHPTEPRLPIVKRVIALPGDRVTLLDGRCWVNGVCPGKDAAAEPANPDQSWELGPGQYFLLGDAPDLSTDSRQFGPVTRKHLRGRSCFVYWPPRRMRFVHRPLDLHIGREERL